MKNIALLSIVFLSLSSNAAMMTKAEYIEVVKEARSTYPIDQGNGTELSDSYMDGDTNIIVTRFKDLGRDYFKQAVIAEMETRLIDSLSSAYCANSGIQSQVRKVGVDIEYIFADKNGDNFWSYTASEKSCQEIRSKSEINKLQANIDNANQQIKKLVEFGNGRVTMCRLEDPSSSVNIGFANELDQPYIFLSAVGEYAVNNVYVYLTKPQLKILNQIIDKATADAGSLKDIETVKLAHFSAKGGALLFVSRFGKISVFFSANDNVDRVLTNPDMLQLKFCLNEGEKLL
ncbi:MAG: hypothetical protein COB03_14685 [Alteromonas sp.]|jgi:hypothetical protein|nr:MAG: hypothetical protein COB03_14685 [Alteromonas sp.]|tara:strand:- start:28 stop:894 length:867 start_codon:yes stop_codon:yes gene_type:complete